MTRLKVKLAVGTTAQIQQLKQRSVLEDKLILWTTGSGRMWILQQGGGRAFDCCGVMPEMAEDNRPAFKT